MMETPLKIIIVEDSAEDRLTYERYIKKGLPAETILIQYDAGKDFLENYQQDDADCILLDYQLPDFDGFDILDLINEDMPSHPPVVMLTGMGSEQIAIDALNKGAYDYINKTILAPEILIKAIQNATEKSALEKQVIQSDQLANNMANIDSLTELASRRYFEKVLAQGLESNGILAVFMIDIDRFKGINESAGHKIGDKILQQIAHRLRKTITLENALARFDGDEFAVMIFIDDVEDAIDVAKSIHQALSDPFIISDNAYKLSVSIGIAVSPHAGTQAEELTRNAEVALTHAKQSGKNTTSFFSNKMTELLSERNEIEQAVQFALANEELSLRYHPILNLDDDSIYALETLVRWKHDRLGAVSPDKFIPIAENTGAIKEIGKWIINTALKDFSSFLDIKPHLKLTINISPVQLKDDTWFMWFRNTLTQHGISPDKIIIELTETAIVKDINTVNVALTQLTSVGCQVYLDDFGTGYSSLNLVRRLPISGLKIDKSYVQQLDRNPDDALLVKSLIAFSEALNLTVVTEGIEKDAQLNYIKSHSTGQLGQGFLFSKPVPADDIKVKLQNDK